MIFTSDNCLEFRFPEVHKRARCSIDFVRTLRLPDDNREYPLPAGLGSFPLHHVDDYRDSVPPTWVEHGGIFLPMYQAEAMWLRFTSMYPMALKVAAGKICALTGEPWTEELEDDPQNYLVIPDQPWLDGFCIGSGLIRQFVAMPLGEGYTAEEQLTGEAQHGGLQFVAYPMEAETYWELFETAERRVSEGMEYALQAPMATSAPLEMGLAPGGLMRQEVYEDEYGLEVWDWSVSSRCFVHVLNSVQYKTVTGTKPPSHPPSATAYAEAGLPWFDYYDSDRTALRGSSTLAGLDSIAAKKIKQGQGTLDDNESVHPQEVVKLQANPVREGYF